MAVTPPAGAPAASGARRRRILFVAEAVTLAHVGRPAALMSSVDLNRFDLYFACDRRSHRFVDPAAGTLLDIGSLDSRVFSERLRQGRPVFQTEELRTAVAADTALIEQVAPDLVIGDFRLSLSVSARLAQVPYATVTNAYWSPYAPRRTLPLPVLPWTKHVPLALAQFAFDRVQARVLKPHCQPLNKVRAEHGLPALPNDLRRVYTDADHVLYADSPTLFPLPGAPANHRHLGALLWSPPVPLPPWWHEVPTDRPLAYVTMGSSGAAGLLDDVLDGLAGLGLNIMASTAGAARPARTGRKVWLADYLPGEAAAARADLVICNGGSPTSQQALAAGKPVLGVCGNMDQFLNMRGLTAAGVGLALRADRLTADALGAAVRTLLHGAGSAAHRPPALAREPHAAAVFAGFLDQVLGAGMPEACGHGTPWL